MSVLLRLPSRGACRRTLLFVSLAAGSPGCGGRADSEGSGASQVANDPGACAGSGTAGTCGVEAAESAPAGEPADSVQPGCPAEMPEPGSSCTGYASWIRCEYDYCGDTAPFSCNRLSGVWEPRVLSCDPGVPLAAGCPTSVPVPGSDCEPEGLGCDYRSECYGAVDGDHAQCRFGQWLVVFATTASCDYFGMPVCPERSIIDGTGCAYEGQNCSPASCPPGTSRRAGHVCRNGVWRATSFTCPSERNPAYGF